MCAIEGMHLAEYQGTGAVGNRTVAAEQHPSVEAGRTMEPYGVLQAGRVPFVSRKPVGVAGGADEAALVPLPSWPQGSDPSTIRHRSR